MNDLDPTAADSLEDLAACLRQVHLRADKPAYRELEQQTIRANGLLPGTRLKRARLGRTTLSDVMLGRKFPSKAFMLTFVDACGIDLENDRRWAQAWDRLAERYLIQGALAETEQLRQQVAVALTARAEADRARQLAEDTVRQTYEEARSEIGRLQAELAARTAELEQTRMEAAQARKAHEEAGDILSSTEKSFGDPRLRKRSKGQGRVEPPSWLRESSGPSPEAQGGPTEDRVEPPSWLPK